MWAMYADEHRGCCLEIELEDSEEDAFEKMIVKYSENIHFENRTESIKDIVRYKTTEWSHEEEVRLFKKSSERPYVKVKIKKVLLGLKVSNIDMWKNVIHAFDSTIKVRNITIEEINKNKLNDELYD